LLWRALHAADGRSAAEIRDAVARVFSGGAFDRSATRTLGGVVMDFIGRILARIFDVVSGSPPLRTALVWTGYAIIALVIVRFVYGAVQRGQLSTYRSPADRRGAAAAGNPWLAAPQAAAKGEYTQAAHFLYAALLVAIARRERVRLHPSKTAGDYVRELRRRSSPVFTPFRAFVRAFDFVIYGRGVCDRVQFEQLRAIAAPLLGAGE
jgi:hypothetical protein